MNKDGIGVELGEPAADNTFPAPELQEIQQEIRKLKNNRATGKNRLPGELFKYGGEKLARRNFRKNGWMVLCVPSMKRAISWIAAISVE